MLVGRAGIHKMIFRIANEEDPDQRRSSLYLYLIWVCTVCLGLFRRQLVFEILEHLPYFESYIDTDKETF